MISRNPRGGRLWDRISTSAYLPLALYITGPFVAISAVAALANSYFEISANGYGAQSLSYLSAQTLADYVLRELTFALITSALLVFAAFLLVKQGVPARTVLPFALISEAGLIISRLLYSTAWSVTMPLYGIPLPGFLWRYEVVLWTAGALAIAFFLAALVIRFRKKRPVSTGASPRLLQLSTFLLVLGLVCGLMAGAAGMVATPQRAPKPFHVVWVTWDSVRADHLSCYGYSRPTTPHLDQVAREGVLFRKNISNHNWTRPSYASMLSSLGAWELPHGFLQPSHLTLTEILRNHGYRTMAFVQNPNLDAEFNTSQGFETYYQLRQRTSPREMNAHALKRLEALAGRGRPVFLFLHYQEPHYPYQVTNPFRREFVKAPKDLLTEDETEQLMLREGIKWNPPPPNAKEILEFLRDAYDSDIRYADEGLGEVVAKLKEIGIYDRTLLIVNSDHGDEFQDHGNFGHTHKNLHPELTYVPLVMRFPDELKAGPAVCDVHVQNWDIFPTVLGALGIPPPKEISGRALLPVPATGAPERLAFSSYNRYLAIRSRQYGLIADYEKAPRFRLYDILRDPAEHQPIEEHSENQEYQKLRPVADAWYSNFGTAIAGGQPKVSKELLNRLRALGYVQ
jgi:arylsulfatase A-like enzyme